jgi:hypothetical protein
LLFGGVLIVASLLGVGHDSDVHVDLHVGDSGHDGDGHDQGQASAWLSLFGLRFWSFAAAFFGLTGVILHLVAGPVLAATAPFIAAAVGVAAGLGASMTFRALSRDTSDSCAARPRWSGARGASCCRSRAGSAGRSASRCPAAATSIWSPSGDDDAALDAGAVVLIVEVRGNVAVVERAPETSPPGRS